MKIYVTEFVLINGDTVIFNNIDEPEISEHIGDSYIYTTISSGRSGLIKFDHSKSVIKEIVQYKRDLEFNEIRLKNSGYINDEEYGNIIIPQYSSVIT